DWLAATWLKTVALPRATVGNAFAVFALVIALRFPENVYRSSLIGLHRQLELGLLAILTTTLRTFGAVAALATFGASIAVFFVWQAFGAVSSLIILGTALYHYLPSAPDKATFSREVLHGIAGFAGGMTGIAVLSVLLTQIDKMLLSYLIPLEEFG